ncbi:MAG TPA: hypothetical protein VJ859_06890 [Allosphingosinicella sp.]|nr:hypothetical protein [Allosphingosinicella sp.]
MWLEILCPPFPAGATVEISRVCAAPGVRLDVGDPLFDLQVDLTAGEWMDCPAVSTVRITMREPVWLRDILVRPGQTVEEHAPLARLSVDPDEIGGGPARPARINVATIVDQSDWWAA